MVLTYIYIANSCYMHALIYKYYMATVSVVQCMLGEPWHASGDLHTMMQLSSWKLIAARLTIHLNGGPFLAMGDHFGCQNWSP